MKPSGNALREFNHRLKKIDCIEIARDVAERACAPLTELAQKAFASGETVYGQARPSGKHGPVTLIGKNKAIVSGLRFFSAGSIRIMARLNGKETNINKRFGYLPYVNDTLPYDWTKAIQKVWLDVMKEWGRE